MGKLLAEAIGTFWLVLGGCGSAVLAAGFASNGYEAHSPNGYSLAACFITEVVLTAMFLFVIHGATDRRSS